MSESSSAEQAETERIEAMLSDYVEGTLSLEERKEVEAHLARHPELKDDLEAMREDQKKLKSLNKTPAPEELGAKVEEIIHRRSAGRFFGRRAFGDRVPFGWLLVAALVLIVAIFFALYQSPTGSLKGDHKEAPRPSNEARESIPKPPRVN
ncbi:MAG TPA: zf-HC2 domain-containing protein [Kofleriaceae bacterium]|nr:zf-HC2 domain-containing protein [Kofleriaceae bacterium]